MICNIMPIYCKYCGKHMRKAKRHGFTHIVWMRADLKKIALRTPAAETEQGEKSCGAICATGNIFSPMYRKIADVLKKR